MLLLAVGGLVQVEAVSAENTVARAAVGAGDDLQAQGTTELPRRPTSGAPGQVYDIFQQHCAACHQTGYGPHATADRGSPTVSLDRGLANILDLAELVQQPHLVTPGRPDASAIYNAMITQTMPPQTKDEDGKRKGVVSADDIRTVRNWIEGLSKRETTCASPPPSKATEQQDIKAWLDRPEVSDKKSFRFISLSTLLSDCQGVQTNALYRLALRRMMSDIQEQKQKVDLYDVNARASVLAFRLSDVGWDAGDWREIVDRAPESGLLSGGAVFDELIAATRTTQPIVPAEWLAARLHQLGWLTLKTNATDTAVTKLHGIDVVSALVRRGGLDVSFDMAAAELGLRAVDLSERLENVVGPAEGPAKYLNRRGVLKRETYATVAREITIGAEEARRLKRSDELFLWTNQLSYKKGNLAIVYATATTDCYLTLFGIDAQGQTTVLFPNDFDQDNLLSPGRTISVPEATAPFQLRVNNDAPEKVVGICTSKTKSPAAVTHQFQRHRFTLLGGWEDFLQANLKAERAAQRATTKRKSKTARRGGAENGKEVDASGRALSQLHLRAAIYLSAEN